MGDSHIILLTDNSLLLFSFLTSTFLEEFKLWEDEKTAKYIRDYNLTDLSIHSEGNTHWLAVGNETGKLIVWKVKISDEEIQKSFQIFDVYNKTRTKRVKWAADGKRLFVVTVSTGGDISVFDFSAEKNREFTNEKEKTKPLAALAEKKMEVRITQLDVIFLKDEAEKKIKKKVQKKIIVKSQKKKILKTDEVAKIGKKLPIKKVKKITKKTLVKPKTKKIKKIVKKKKIVVVKKKKPVKKTTTKSKKLRISVKSKI